MVQIQILYIQWMFWWKGTPGKDKGIISHLLNEESKKYFSIIFRKISTAFMLNENGQISFGQKIPIVSLLVLSFRK